MRDYVHDDVRGRLPAGLELQYHSRSSAPSNALARLIVADIVDSCPVLREQAARGEVAFAIDRSYRWDNGKDKKIDLAIGLPHAPVPVPRGERIARLTIGRLRRLFVAVEEKAVMTEHGKSQPRIFCELNDSHTMVHQGSRDTIAGGITYVNIAKSFISPLRQQPGKAVEITPHRQPDVTSSMIRHLRGLPIRNGLDDVGLDAYSTFVVDVDNQGRVELWEQPPAPQPGDADHYETFIERISALYADRYEDLAHLPEAGGLSIEDSLVKLATEYPGLLEVAGRAALESGREGAKELDAILQSLVVRANPPEDDEE